MCISSAKVGSPSDLLTESAQGYSMFQLPNCDNLIALRRGISISVPKTRLDPIERLPLTLEFKTRRQLVIST